MFLTGYATYRRWNRFGGLPGSKGCELVSRAPFGGPFFCLVACVCLCVSFCADGHPASNAPDSPALPIDSTFSTTEVEKEAADGHPAPNAPDLSRIPAQTDLASKTTLKKFVFHCDSARFQRISPKSRILEKVRESPLVSGLSNLDGGPPIKPVRESVAQFLHAKSSSNGSPEASSASGSVSTAQTG